MTVLPPPSCPSVHAAEAMMTKYMSQTSLLPTPSESGTILDCSGQVWTSTLFTRSQSPDTTCWPHPVTTLAALERIMRAPKWHTHLRRVRVWNLSHCILTSDDVPHIQRCVRLYLPHCRRVLLYGTPLVTTLHDTTGVPPSAPSAHFKAETQRVVWVINEQQMAVWTR